MIRKAAFILADGVVPYRNQAVEELLMRTVDPETIVLYLWQNRRTVVIGRNQNARAECRVELLHQDGGHLARRLSGGGAVFHDLGNVNFSFLAMDPDYSVPRQQRVILAAVRSFGLEAAISGRNDITACGRKFSGNAFISSGPRHCHHGTLLISADTSHMAKYLSVSQDKLESKGVRSVRSRVVNLSELAPGITVDTMSDALYRAFGAEYGAHPERLQVSDLDQGLLESLTRKFSSPAWRLEAEPDFRFREKRRFAWGGAELCLHVSGGKVDLARLFTDALDAGLSETVQNALQGLAFSKQALCDALARVPCGEQQRPMLLDISSLLMEVE